MSTPPLLPADSKDSLFQARPVLDSDRPFVAKDFAHMVTLYKDSSQSSALDETTDKQISFFQETPFQSKSLVTHERTEILHDWILLVFLICFSILSWIMVSYRKRFNQVVKSTYSKQQLGFLLREGGGSYDLINLSLGFVFINVLALLMFRAAETITGSSWPAGSRLPFYLLVGGGIISWLLIRLVLIRMLGWTFKNFEITSQYLMNSMAFHFIMGIILLPLLVISAYTFIPAFIYLSLGIAGILFILRLFRGIIIGLSDTNFSIFYLFFYLCTVEILPILVIVKLAKDNL